MDLFVRTRHLGLVCLNDNKVEKMMKEYPFYVIVIFFCKADYNPRKKPRRYHKNAQFPNKKDERSQAV